jgi:solute carrier family 9 (sodium/hydrogen exchanger), member 8
MGRQLYMWNKNDYAHSHDHELTVAKFMLAYFMILIAVVYLQHFVGKVWKWRYLPESGVAILVGSVISGAVRLRELYGSLSTSHHEHLHDLVSFSPTLFFLGLLPPIIFNSGYQIKHHLFFANMGGILALAFYGTSFSAFFLGVFLNLLGQTGLSPQLTLFEGLCFGSLISATDPVSTLAVFAELKVDPNLFYLVFGESVRLSSHSPTATHACA